MVLAYKGVINLFDSEVRVCVRVGRLFGGDMIH